MATLSETHNKLYKEIFPKMTEVDFSNRDMLMPEQVSIIFGNFEYYFCNNDSYTLFILKHNNRRKNIYSLLCEYFPKDMANVIQSYCYTSIYLVYFANLNYIGQYEYKFKQERFFNKYNVLMLLNKAKVYKSVGQLKKFLSEKLDSFDDNLTNLLK